MREPFFGHSGLRYLPWVWQNGWPRMAVALHWSPLTRRARQRRAGKEGDGILGASSKSAVVDIFPPEVMSEISGQ